VIATLAQQQEVPVAQLRRGLDTLVAGQGRHAGGRPHVLSRPRQRFVAPKPVPAFERDVVAAVGGARDRLGIADIFGGQRLALLVLQAPAFAARDADEASARIVAQGQTEPDAGIREGRQRAAVGRKRRTR